MHRVSEGRRDCCLRKKFAKLDRIEFNEPITEESNRDFFYHLQNALLLSLREQGRLSFMQYRYAQERLTQQYRQRAGRKQEEP